MCTGVKTYSSINYRKSSSQRVQYTFKRSFCYLVRRTSYTVLEYSVPQRMNHPLCGTIVLMVHVHVQVLLLWPRPAILPHILESWVQCTGVSCFPVVEYYVPVLPVVVELQILECYNVLLYWQRHSIGNIV